MRDMTQTARLLGYVQVQVGSKVFALPVQSVHFEAGGETDSAGGFFEEASGDLGIIVDGDATPNDVQAQIVRASAEAVRHLSKRILN